MASESVKLAPTASVSSASKLLALVEDAQEEDPRELGDVLERARVVGPPHDVGSWLIERGFRFGIVAADCLERPHVHVEGHGGEAKLWLDPVRVARTRGYNAHRLGEIVLIVGEHETDFLESWHGFCPQAD